MPRRERRDDPIPLKEVLGKVTGSLGLGKPDEHVELVAAWFRCVEEPMQSQVRPAYLRGGVLTLHTHSNAWASQMQYMSQLLIDRLTGEGLEIHEIKVVLTPE